MYKQQDQWQVYLDAKCKIGCQNSIFPANFEYSQNLFDFYFGSAIQFKSMRAMGEGYQMTGRVARKKIARMSGRDNILCPKHAPFLPELDEAHFDQLYFWVNFRSSFSSQIKITIRVNFIRFTINTWRQIKGDIPRPLGDLNNVKGRTEFS